MRLNLVGVEDLGQILNLNHVFGHALSPCVQFLWLLLSDLSSPQLSSNEFDPCCPTGSYPTGSPYLPAATPPSLEYCLPMRVQPSPALAPQSFRLHPA